MTREKLIELADYMRENEESQLSHIFETYEVKEAASYAFEKWCNLSQSEMDKQDLLAGSRLLDYKVKFVLSLAEKLKK